MPNTASTTRAGSKRSIERFEDLIGWQKARVLVREVYLATRKGTFSRDWALASQVQRAAVSVMSNIAEGFERNHRREFFQFLGVAKAFSAEVRSLLYVARDTDHINQQQFDSLMTLSEEIARVIGGLRSAVERRLTGTESRV